MSTALDPTSRAERETPRQSRPGWVHLGAGLLIAWATITVGIAGATGTLFLDDLALNALANSRSWPDPEYLGSTWFGHIFPGGLLILWFEARLFGTAKVWYGITQGAGIMVAGVLFYRVVQIQLGNRAVGLLPLGLFLTSTAVFSAASWWANALWLTPLLVISLLAVIVLLRAGSDPNPQKVFVLLGLIVGGLLFTEKTALLPFCLFAMGIVVAHGTDPQANALVLAWQRWRGLWLGSLAILVLYAAVYLASNRGVTGTLPFSSQPDQIPAVIARVWTDGLPAGLFGGPIRWINPILAAPPPWFATWSSWLLLAIVLLTIAANRSSRLLMFWAALYISATAGLLAVSRFLGEDAVMVVLQVRYYADGVLWLCLATIPAIATITSFLQTRSTWLRYLAATTAVAVSVTTCIFTTVSFAAALRTYQLEGETSIQKSIDRTVASLLQMDPDQAVLDLPLRAAPFQVVEFNVGQPVMMSDFYGPLVGRHRFVDSSADPVIDGGGGQFTHAIANGHVVDLSPTVCLRQAAPRASVQLPAGLFGGQHLLRVAATGAGPASASARLDLGEGGTLSFDTQTPETTTWVEGGGDVVHFTLQTGDTLCLSGLEVGPALHTRVAR